VSNTKDSLRFASYGFLVVTLSTGRGGAHQRRRWILLISVGGVPPDVCPSGAGLGRGTRVGFSLLPRTRMTPNRGCVSSNRHRHRGVPLHAGTRALVCRGGPGDRLGHGPHEGHQVACDGHHDQVGVFASSGQCSVAFAQPHLGVPTNILDGGGQLFQTPLEMTTDLGRVAVGPGAFDQRPTGMAIARFGDAALMPPLTRGIFRREQPHITHELSRVIEPGEVSQCCHDRDGHGALDPTQGLEGLDH
jgi:hypothetical protein